ncbi:hypothetical protein V5F40_00035 [Xanthobacter sp. DSM 14520]|uniref:hypothetical protein n=1 Tax=Xanthobacter autotrophicus (strain ATCC BAA-1158 / Py2) TaxID=78245 RepID=UPI00372A07B4
MTTTGLIRTSSGFLPFKRRMGRKDWETNDRWRDKRAQGALWSGGCFCRWIFSQTHIVPLIDNVRRTLKPLTKFAFSHLAGARHGR